MGHCLAKAMLEMDHREEYNELATKPGPLSAEEQAMLLHHKARLAAALEAEYFSSPHSDKDERFRCQWREWFGEDAPRPEEAMCGLTKHFPSQGQRAFLDSITPEMAREFFAGLEKRKAGDS